MMNYKIIVAYLLLIAVLIFLIFAYVKYSTIALQNESEEIKKSIIISLDKKLDFHRLSNVVIKEEVQTIIRESIEKDPEIILNALDRLDNANENKVNEEEKCKINNMTSLLFEDHNDPTVGPPKAELQIIEFFDYRCIYCKKMLEVKKEVIQANPKVRFIFKELPILGKLSTLASKMSVSIYLIEPSKYFTFQQELLKRDDFNTVDDLFKIAKEVGVDQIKLKEFWSDKNSNKRIDKIIENNLQIAKTLKIKGSPTYILKDEISPGFINFTSMQELIDSKKSENPIQNLSTANKNNDIEEDFINSAEGKKSPITNKLKKFNLDDDTKIFLNKSVE